MCSFTILSICHCQSLFKLCNWSIYHSKLFTFLFSQLETHVEIGRCSCTETLIIFEDLYLTAASCIDQFICLPVDVPTNEIWSTERELNNKHRFNVNTFIEWMNRNQFLLTTLFLLSYPLSNTYDRDVSYVVFSNRPWNSLGPWQYTKVQYNTLPFTTSLPSSLFTL